jgi:hypothetical protein
MAQPTPAPTCHVASEGPPGPPPSSGEAWFRTRDGRRYGREIGVVIVVKLALLILLWFAFIKPWPRAATAPEAVAQHLYSPFAQARHD